jgi:sec-independent protein translocase protein TatC
MSTVIGDLHGTPTQLHWRDALGQAERWLLYSMAAIAAALSDMSFFDHLEELRKRLIRCAIAVGVGMMVSLNYNAQLILWLKKPAQLAGINIQAIGGTEIFSIYFKVAAAAGICLAAPVILWQIWRFIEPALYKHEKRYAVPFLLSTILCFVLGAAFGLSVAAPWLLGLEATWAKAVQIVFNPTSDEYFSLLTATVVAMGAVFEIPPVVAVLSRIGLVNAGFLLRHSKHAVIISAVVAAAATPSGDLPPMIAFMSVILAIYAVSILLAWIFAKPRRSDA